MGLFSSGTLGTIGGIGGAIFGGPVGGIIGSATGSLLGDALFGGSEPEVYYQQPQQFVPVGLPASGVSYGQPRQQISPAELNLIAQQRSIQPTAQTNSLAQQLGVVYV